MWHAGTWYHLLRRAEAGASMREADGAKDVGTLLPRSWPQRTLQPRDWDEAKHTLPTLAECLRVGWNLGERGGHRQAPGKLKDKGGEALRWAQRARGPLGEGVRRGAAAGVLYLVLETWPPREMEQPQQTKVETRQSFSVSVTVSHQERAHIKIHSREKSMQAKAPKVWHPPQCLQWKKKQMVSEVWWILTYIYSFLNACLTWQRLEKSGYLNKATGRWLWSGKISNLWMGILIQNI